jgi:ubiquinone biosynthesis protein UbiJ
VAAGLVQVAPDSTGKKIQTFENTISTNVVEAQAVVPVDSTGVERTAWPVTDNGGSLTVDSTQLPAALAANGGMKIEGVASGVPVPVSGTVTANVGTLPAVTKGTQGSTGITTQDLKDAGRSQVLLAWDLMAGTAAVESTLTNFTFGTKAGAALTGATSYTVTSGKTLRIQSIALTLIENATTCIGRFRIRQAASAIANTSPPIFDYVLGSPAGTAAAKQGTSVVIPIPDGLEVAGGQQITFTWFSDVNTCQMSMSIVGYEY